MPVHNRAHLLDLVLDRLAENTTYEDVELICVDDGSDDGSRDILHRWAASGRIPWMRVTSWGSSLLVRCTRMPSWRWVVPPTILSFSFNRMSFWN